MNRTIWKFVLAFGDEPEIEMPKGAQPIHADIDSQAGVVEIWAVVNPAAPFAIRRFILRGTGHPLPSVGPHIATVKDGPFVWHLFNEWSMADLGGLKF